MPLPIHVVDKRGIVAVRCGVTSILQHCVSYISLGRGLSSTIPNHSAKNIGTRVNSLLRPVPDEAAGARTAYNTTGCIRQGLMRAISFCELSLQLSHQFFRSYEA